MVLRLGYGSETRHGTETKNGTGTRVWDWD